MSFSDEKKKRAWLLAPLGCLMAGASCGVPFIPGVWGTKVLGIPYPRFVLGTSEGGQELHIVESGLLKNKEQIGEIPFDKVTMKWGYRQLTANDALISCEKDKYYVGKHIWGNEYFLHSGKKFFWSENSCSSIQGGNGKAIKPNFEKTVKNGATTSTTSTATKILLPVGTCKFKLTNGSDVSSEKKSLNMNCDGYTDDPTATTGGGNNKDPYKQQKITLCLKEEYFQSLYNPFKVKN